VVRVAVVRDVAVGVRAVGVRTEVLDPHLEVRATPEVPYAGRLMLNVVPKYLVYEKQPCLLHRDENQS
jgi:hypothetical protein